MEEMLKTNIQFIYYVATYMDVIFTNTASDMVFKVHNDTLHLSKPKARIQAVGNFFLEVDTSNTTKNGTVLNIAQIIKAVITSAAEAELCALFINSREDII